MHAVIPAGGSGTRLWPISRTSRPKFLQPLVHPVDSLLQQTVARVEQIPQLESIYVVTSVDRAGDVADQVEHVARENILAEPEPRDSFAAISLAAAIIATRAPNAVMGSFAADHVVTDIPKFARTISAAIEAADSGALVTVGMTPTYAETGFGYIERDANSDTTGAFPVLAFTEKPTLDVAQQFLEAGTYLWNAGMFVWRVDSFLSEVSKRQPQAYATITTIAAAWDTPERDDVLAEHWPRMPRIALEYAVIEPAAADGAVLGVAGDFGWNDIGDFRNLRDLLPRDENANAVTGRSHAAATAAIFEDAGHNTVIGHSGRVVALLGVEGLIVVDTDDALLVCSAERAQDVKRVVDELRASRADLT